MTAPGGGRALWIIAVVAVASLAGCGAQAAAPEPAAAPTTAIPEGWVTVSTTGAEIQVTLPPWLQVFDNINTIFANEPPAQGENEIPIQLMAVPPGIDVDPGPGDDLVAWIDSRLDDPGKGLPVVTDVSLPTGTAVRYERVDRAGTPMAWRILAFAIRTRSGVAYLLIDGLPEAWPARVEDIERIPFLVRVR